MPTPQWIKEILAKTAQVSVPVPAPEPPAEPEPMPNPMTAEEYSSEVAVDEAEVQEVLEEQDPPIVVGVPEGVQDQVREAAAEDQHQMAAEEGEEVETRPCEFCGCIRQSTHPSCEGGLNHPPTFQACPECIHEELIEVPEPEPPKPPRPPRRFEFALKATDLKAFVALLEPLVDEVKVTANRDGWHVLAVDPAQVALVELHLTDLIDAFERIRSTNTLERIPEDVAFGLDLVKLKEILRLTKKDDTVSMVVDLPDDEDKDRITVEIGRTRRTMPAIDTDGMADPKVPVLNLPARLRVNVQDLADAVKASESISDHVRLTATRDGLNVLAEGDTDKVSLDLAADVEEVQGDKATSLFPLDDLGAFVKAVRNAKVEMLVVRLGTDYPIRMDWDGTVRGTWLCAPRIETE